MNMQKIREVSKERGIKAGKMNKTELIRTMQSAEGNNDCFASRHVDVCNQLECLWRKDCCEANRE